jgi:hypothetical protein
MGTLRLTDVQLTVLIVEAELLREQGEMLEEGFIEDAAEWLVDKAMEKAWGIFTRVMRNNRFAAKVLRKAGALLGQLSELIGWMGMGKWVKPETMAGIMKWMARLGAPLGLSAGTRWGFNKLADVIEGMSARDWAEVWDATVATGAPAPATAVPSADDAASVDGPQAGDVMSTVTRSGKPRLVVVTDDLGDGDRVQVRQYVGGKPVGAPYSVPRDRLADVGKERLAAGHNREVHGTVTILDEAALRREIKRVIRR